MSIPRNCANCRFWSDFFAEVGESGQMTAKCENGLSPLALQLTYGNDKCGEWLSAADDPALAEAA